MWQFPVKAETKKSDHSKICWCLHLKIFKWITDDVESTFEIRHTVFMNVVRFYSIFHIIQFVIQSRLICLDMLCHSCLSVLKQLRMKLFSCCVITSEWYQLLSESVNNTSIWSKEFEVECNYLYMNIIYLPLFTTMIINTVSNIKRNFAGKTDTTLEN